MGWDHPLTDDEAWENATRPRAFDWIAVALAVALLVLLGWVIFYTLPIIWRGIPFIGG